MIRSLGVIGSGTMGSGIAQVAARSGLAVILNDVSTDLITRGMARIEKGLSREAEKGRLSATEKSDALSRIKTSDDLTSLSEVDFVVEAVNEDFGVKASVFRKAATVTRPEVILASNTSSISITRLGAASGRPDRFIGMHFMNPVPIMKLVEIIRGVATSDETYAQTRALSEKLGKTPWEVNDSPGFVSNRVLMPMINEAVFALYEGVGTPEAIDQIMKLGMNHPMGPLELADFIGLDVCLAIMNVLYEGFSDSKYRPCPLLKKYVDAGWLGKKSGRGFYRY
ncbi:MAG TPA: 3-hydroxybutyryl-CoA dehydrogenase [Blastocatellia bacterium]|nr:3-hydroxybutyryl-CoA dehydrogenase [Blastocatellia bacterium]